MGQFGELDILEESISEVDINLEGFESYDSTCSSTESEAELSTETIKVGPNMAETKLISTQQ